METSYAEGYRRINPEKRKDDFPVQDNPQEIVRFRDESTPRGE